MVHLAANRRHKKVCWRESRCRRSKFLLLAAAMAAWPLSAQHAEAQSFPERPITLVVAFAPGGSTSIVARAVSDKMSEALGQKIIVDNRAGAGGTIGTKAVAGSAPDGYTIALGYTGTLAIGPTLYTNAGYDPRKDFAPIGMIGNAPNSLVVNPTFPAKTVAELIAYAKTNPEKVTSVRPVSARPVMCRASILQPRPASSWCMFPTKALVRR